MNFNTVFLTYGGWLFEIPIAAADKNLPNSSTWVNGSTWIGGCSVCWSPAVAVPASEEGECTCCGHVGPVLSGEDLMIHESRWNTYKHLPGGPGMTYRKHWELARLMNIQLKLAEYVATRAGGSFTEVPKWVEKVSEGFDLSPLGVRLTTLYGDYPGRAVGMEKVLGGECYSERLTQLTGALDATGEYSSRKAFLEKNGHLTADGKTGYTFREVIVEAHKNKEDKK